MNGSTISGSYSASAAQQSFVRSVPDPSLTDSMLNDLTTVQGSTFSLLADLETKLAMVLQTYPEGGTKGEDRPGYATALHQGIDNRISSAQNINARIQSIIDRIVL